MAHCSHLGSVVFTDNCGHNITAKGRTGLEKQSPLLIDGKFGTVRGQSGLDLSRDPGNQRTPDRGGAGQDYLRFMLSD